MQFENISDVVTGTFDGQLMNGDDGNIYPVPANYASKSKLLEGDILKLTILEDGKFIYKQINPMTRHTSFATIDLSEKFPVATLTDGTTRKILQASVSFFNIEHGDRIVVLISPNKDDQWAAIEAVLS